MRSAGVSEPARIRRGAVGDHEGGGHLAEELDRREVRGRQAVPVEAGVEVFAGHGPEGLQVPVFPGEGGHDPGAGQALLQAGHDEGDLVPDAQVGAVGVPAEPHGEPQEHRHDGQGDQGQAPVDHEQHDRHPDGGQAAGHQVDDPLLEQLGQGFDVAGHTGQDPPAHLPLVEIESQPAQVGEDLESQGVEEPLGQAPRPSGRRPQRPPVEKDHGGEGHGGGREPGRRPSLHPVGDSGPHQGRAGEAGQGVDRHQADPDGQRPAERSHEAPEGEARVGSGGRRGVDSRVRRRPAAGRPPGPAASRRPAWTRRVRSGPRGPTPPRRCRPVGPNP